MDINFLKRLQVPQSGVDTDELLDRLSSGTAILFTGAGFSKKCTKVDGGELLLAKDLAAAICRRCSIEEDDDLRYASDYHIKKFGSSGLIELLKKEFTIIKTPPDVDTICSIPWRRFYTTNYDQSIETSRAKLGKVTECIDIDYNAAEYYKRESLCIHLNGSINNLTDETLNDSFKLSASSYISPDSFLKSPWNYFFKKDLERAAAIVFAGYSLYDIDIQKVLYENEYLKEKTYFITRPEPSSKTIFTLSNFGHVLPIGIEGFAELINKNPRALEENEDLPLRSIGKYEFNKTIRSPRDAEIESSLLFGHHDLSLIENAVLNDEESHYLVVRENLEQIAGFVRSGQNTIITGAFGNGKSIILQELKPYLSSNSIDVYEVIDPEGDCAGEMDILAKQPRTCVIIIDDYSRYIHLLAHHALTKPEKIIIIAAARDSEHERNRENLGEIDFQYAEISTDILTAQESSDFVEIIDHVGLWGDKAGLSKERKLRFLQKENNLQFSLALLTLLKAPQMKNRVSALLKNLLEKKSYKDTIFAIAFIETLGSNNNFSTISEVAGNNEIYHSGLRSDPGFKELFKLNATKVISKSSLFCLSLIQNHFSPSYVSAQLQLIAKNLDKYRSGDSTLEHIFKATLRFSSVESILPDANKLNTLKHYYESLKTTLPWLKKDPHYWLQYGMACLAFDDFGKAQSNFDQAYSIAELRDNYHTEHIDTQQARLYLKKSIKLEQDPNVAYNAFEQANSLLSRIKNDPYKFRQVQLYLEFYERFFNGLSIKNRVKLEHSCKAMLRTIERIENTGETHSKQSMISRAKDNLSKILHDIEKERAR
ncbi:SIR2 family protein [Pseudomonas stutzeri]|uniref:SIR2 family protein n=1 Tax=Stutzerimonas stutzeri TaxID=316 RepID=UPI00210AC5C8|nr:SIR2 family protein [Stutzerimonas stutzeri]